MAKKKEPNRVRFFFPRDMTPEEIVDATIRLAKRYGIPIKDSRKEEGIPIVDSRKKFKIKGEKGDK